jgi:endonuclease YncB( thermonuclease family)
MPVVWVVRAFLSMIAMVAVFAASAAFSAPDEGTNERIVGRAKVVDGDTIEIGDRRIHLYGIDAPEFKQTCRLGERTYACGEEAAFALADEIAQATLVCDPVDVNRFGRVIAVCWLGPEDVNARMVSRGWALAHRGASPSREAGPSAPEAYVAAEDEARLAGRGLWRGEFDPPWEWRAARHRPRTAREI